MSSDPSIDCLSHEAHIWLTEPAAPEDFSNYLPLLSPPEIEQFERFRVETARRLYLAARALARSVLSKYHPEVAPGDWHFRFNAHGRPEIEGPPGWPPTLPPLGFNLSHTDGLVACLVGLGLESGVDVEYIERRINLSGVARHSFSALEADDVITCDGRTRRERFFRYWTLKEAYIKARGMGLALPLKKFSYLFPDSETVSIEFDPDMGDRTRDWQLALWQASPEHYLAAALKRPDTSDRKWVVRRATPLGNDAQVVELPKLARSKAKAGNHV